MKISSVIIAGGTIAIVALSGCVETTQAGLPTSASTKYKNVGVVAGVSDSEVSTYWRSAFSEPVPTNGELGWNASAATTELIARQLEAAGAKVSSLRTPKSDAAKANDVVLVVRQTPLNKLGQDYNPGRDLFTLGGGLFAVAAVAAAEEDKQAIFQPRFVIWIRNPKVDRSLVGENACTVGLDASLIDPRSGEEVTDGTRAIGRSVIDIALEAKNFERLPEDQKGSVLAACRLALRSAVSQVLTKIDLTD